MASHFPDLPSPMKQTVIYRFVCACGQVNSGTLSVVATCMSSAKAQALVTPLTCTRCGESVTRKNLALDVQLLSF